MENPVSTRASPDERTIKCFEVVHNGTRAADSKQDGQGSVAHLNPLPSVCRANALDRVVEPRDWWSNVEGTAMRQLAGAAARITSTSGFCRFTIAHRSITGDTQLVAEGSEHRCFRLVG